MTDLNNNRDGFALIIIFQIAAVVSCFVLGIIFTYLVQPSVASITPTEGYGPLLAWVVSAGLGYLGGVIVVSIVALFIAVGYYKKSVSDLNTPF